MQLTLAERRLRGIEVHRWMDAVRDAAKRGDEEPLASAIAGVAL